MLKVEFREYTAVLLVLASVAIGIALIGTNPLDAPNILDAWVRIAFGVLGLALLAGLLLSIRIKRQSAVEEGISPEFLQRLRTAQEEFAKLTPDHQIIAEKHVGQAIFQVLNENILESSTEVIVSSDDNRFGARGGVAKAILGKAGSEVENELARYRQHHFKQGQIAITTGGAWGSCRAIIHPAVIDLDENRYPTAETIKSLVRRILNFAVALGAESVSFPVLGGGTASKYLEPTSSVRAISEEVLAFLSEQSDYRYGLTYVALYIFNRSDAEGLPRGMTKADDEVSAHNETIRPAHPTDGPSA